MRLLLIAIFTAALAACDLVPQYGMVEGAAVIATDKTLVDHAVSWASGKDCSVVRVEQGRTYCVEDAPVAPRFQGYCYRELGGVTCYGVADPVNAARLPVDVNEHNYARSR